MLERPNLKSMELISFQCLNWFMSRSWDKSNTGENIIQPFWLARAEYDQVIWDTYECA